jgi:hypothetical protein
MNFSFLTVLSLFIFLMGVWFSLAPQQVMSVFNSLAIWIVSQFFLDNTALLIELRKTQRCLRQKNEMIRPNLRAIRYFGIAVILVSFVWMWIAN